MASAAEREGEGLRGPPEVRGEAAQRPAQQVHPEDGGARGAGCSRRGEGEAGRTGSEATGQLTQRAHLVF